MIWWHRHSFFCASNKKFNCMNNEHVRQSCLLSLFSRENGKCAPTPARKWKILAMHFLVFFGRRIWTNYFKRRSCFRWEDDVWENKTRLSTPQKTRRGRKRRNRNQQQKFPFHTAENSLPIWISISLPFITLWGRRIAMKAVKLKT